MRASVLGLLLASSLFVGTGCSEYHYFDVTAELDTTLNGNGVRSTIQRCWVTVSNANGGIEDEFLLPRGGNDLSCALSSQSSGTFEYSTKGSGSLKFTFSVYDGQMTTPNCEIGRGETTVEDKETTNFGSLTVMTNNSGGCT